MVSGVCHHQEVNDVWLSLFDAGVSLSHSNYMNQLFARWCWFMS